MSNTIIKYILWILITIPILVFGTYLFIKLLKDFFRIQKIDDNNKKREEAEKASYYQFEENYKKDHPGEF